MAVRHGYGKIAGADALVFAYDTGDTVNSFKGRPTINYGPADLASWALESADVKRIATGNYYKGQPTYNCRTALGSSWIALNTTISGLRTAAGTGGTVTMSCMVRNSNSTAYPMYAFIGHDFGSTRTIAANSDWQKIQWTVNQSNMNNDYVEFRPYTNTDGVYLEMTMPMVEVNVTNASQFVNGTRSATQGLLDLTGNTSIDLSNVSFDSNAQMTFDGTDDDIDAGIGTSTSLQRTIEMVFKTNTLGYLYPLACYTRGGGQSVVTGKRMWLGFQSNKFQMHGWGTSDPSSTTTIQTGQYYHAVYAYDQDTKKHYIWINGVLENNSTNDQEGFTSWNNSGDHKWFVGGDPDYASWTASAGRSLDGEIPIFKVYDRILSSTEVQSNFNHYKSRFGI